MYLSESIANPPKNYQRSGATPPSGNGPYNTISVIDLATAQIKVIAKAAPGAGLDLMRWSDDGKKLYFIAGEYAGTEYINTPMFNDFDFSTGNVVKGSAIYTGSTDQLTDYQVCAGTLYYVTEPAGKLSIDAQLWAAPLQKLSNRAMLALPDPALYYAFSGCITLPT